MTECGCDFTTIPKLKSFKQDGSSKHPLYNTWANMVRRANPYSSSSESVLRYRKKGILICTRWRKSFKDFLNDVGEKPSNDMSLDRIDNSGMYCPHNVKWSTHREQMCNRGIYKNKKQKTSKYGKYISKVYKKYCFRLHVGFKTYRSDYFYSLEECKKARNLFYYEWCGEVFDDFIQ